MRQLRYSTAMIFFCTRKQLADADAHPFAMYGFLSHLVGSLFLVCLRTRLFRRHWAEQSLSQTGELVAGNGELSQSIQAHSEILVTTPVPASFVHVSYLIIS